ncbi:MAG: membrane protein insertase YidC [Candidatus Omnitrophica bacterium]|nr:membrane protein insertase YidC [Candidatus Omnitrophota bacterium]
MKDMEKRTLLALVLSFLVLGFYPVILEKFYPQAKAPVAARQTAALQPAAPVVKPLLSHGEFADAKDVVLANRDLRVVLNPAGGAVREISFLNFVDHAKNAPIRFFSLKSPSRATTFVDLVDSPVDPKELSGDYVVTRQGHTLTAIRELSSGLRITKEYRFQEAGYGVDLGLSFENGSDKPLDFRYQLYAGSSLDPRHSIDNQYLEANFYSHVSDRAVLRHINETKPGKVVQSQDVVEWVAVKDRHFSVILKPKTEKTFTGLVEGLGQRHFGASLLSEKIILAPKTAVNHSFVLYAGPNEVAALLPFGLDPIVNFGKMDLIGKLLVGMLELLNRVFHNYGIAIIILTLLTNLLLFPLTRLSFMSMKRMQLVQPHMNKLKEQHKHNPERLNKETMELYKKHKVNPFGGCLPMLLQMPIFIALYVALSKSVILINSKLLWIKDLSLPDSVPLPFALPFLGAEIHVLPLLMVGAMVIQQKMTQVKVDGQDPNLEMQQKMMSAIMPVMFGFIFYSMPSGLVLYWLTNTVWMTLYQLSLKNTTLA